MKLNIDKIAAVLVKLSIQLGKYLKFKTWKPGEKLKILMVGYNGKQNTGSDARVESMARQFMHILGVENVQIGVVIFDEKSVDQYFPPPIKQERISSIFFWPMLKLCSAYHMAVLSEGCCLKSKFSNSLLLYFLQCVGIAKVQNKPCLAYGVEAGYMDRFVHHMTAQICDKVHFIARTQPSLDIVQKMELKGELGTDSAWITKSAPNDWALKELQEKLPWDPRKPLVGVAVINPFCWPVKPDIKRFLTFDWCKNPDGHYKRWYFFSESDQREIKLESYVSAIAKAVEAFAQKHNASVAIIGMEALDIIPCKRFKKHLQVPAHIFSSLDYDGCKMTSLLRSLSILVTSRYHARVLSMPGGVPSIAVSMDERLYNLMAESNHLNDYYFDTEHPRLEFELTNAMEKIWDNKEKVSKEILMTIPGYLKTLAHMGQSLNRLVETTFPEFPMPRKPDHWCSYLPSLDPELLKMVKL